MKEQIEKKNCKECLHFEACCKWTDFPKQLGFPVCRKYRKQRVGEWLSVEGDVIFKCSLCDTEISTSWDYEEENMFRYCPCCGAEMKGGAE